MGGVDAEGITAQVMQVQIRRYRADKHLINSTVRRDGLSIVVDRSIDPMRLPAYPEPTARFRDMNTKAPFFRHGCDVVSAGWQLFNRFPYEVVATSRLTPVLGHSDQCQMFRVKADAVQADVVHLHAYWDRPDVKLIGNTMDQAPATGLGHANVRIASSLVSMASEFPTAGVGINMTFSQKPLQRRYRPIGLVGMSVFLPTTQVFHTKPMGINGIGAISNRTKAARPEQRLGRNRISLSSPFHVVRGA